MSSDVKRYAGLDGREYVALDDYTALKAENARLVREAKNDAIAYKAVLERQDELRAERDAARAQLAAIQGGMGEVIEPWQFDWTTYLAISNGWPEEVNELVESIPSEPLMAVAQHQRITAAMAAEVERLSRMLNNATNDGIKLADERDALSAQLRDANSLADQWAEKIAALSAQQSAPERVSVPVELLEQVLNVMDNYVTHETREEDQLRAILASHQRGEA